MKNILARGQREVLEQLAFSKVLLGFDFDGTLAPIVANPDRAGMRARTRRLLQLTAQRYPVTVISGRARSDVSLRLEATGITRVIGNHGLEPAHAFARYERRVARFRTQIEEAIGGLGGVVIEDKGLSLAIHYRRSRQKRIARAAILAATHGLSGARIVGGKLVVNVLPIGAPHKGIALVAERKHARCDTALYIGDDDTDEDVFGFEPPGRLLSIRVGKKRGSAAMYFVEGQAQVDDLLHVLNELRNVPAGKSRRET